MKGKLIISFEDVPRIEYNFEEPINCEPTDYKIWITLPKGKKVDESKLKLGLNKYLLRKLNGKGYQKNFPERVEILKEAYSKDIDLLDASEEIIVRGDAGDVFSSLPSVKDKKVVIETEQYPLTIESVEALEREFQGYRNIYVRVEGNDDPISLTEYRKTVEIIDEVVDRIKSYNLSPLEQVIYAYDYARDRIYQKEECGQPPTTSRDLTRVLLGDEIVCVGYARIFTTILKKLGINASEYTVEGERYHAIAIAHIKDQKYDIDSIYYFDPTADRKRDDTDNHFNRYFAFAKNRVEMLEEFGYADLTFGEADESAYLEIIKQLQENTAPKWLHYGETKYINNMSSFINKRPMDVNIHGFTSATEKVKENPNIASEVVECKWYLLPFQNPKALVKAISAVRKLQYYEDSEKYPYSSDTISTIARNSQWNRPYRYYTNSVNRILSENSERYDKEAREIDLVKVLRKVKEQKEHQPN